MESLFNICVQVGDASKDHSYWGPPEKMTMERPAYKINAAKPGSDIAMETAAAMAAGYLAFKSKGMHRQKHAGVGREFSSLGH